MYQQGTQGTYRVQILQKDRLLKLRNLRPNFVAHYKGLQGAMAHTAATAMNTRANPLHWVLLRAIHNTQDQRFSTHPKVTVGCNDFSPQPSSPKQKFTNLFFSVLSHLYPFCQIDHFCSSCFSVHWLISILWNTAMAQFFLYSHSVILINFLLLIY